MIWTLQKHSTAPTKAQYCALHTAVGEVVLKEEQILGFVMHVYVGEVHVHVGEF